MRRFALAAFFIVACHGEGSTPPTPNTITTAPSAESTSPVASATPPATTSAFDAAVLDGVIPDAGPGPCGPTKVTVDDQPMSIKTARAYGFASIDDAYVLVLSSKNVSCADLVKGSRAIANDEVYVDVGAGPLSNIQQYVNARNERAEVPTDLVTKPKNAGDPIQICVRAPGRITTVIGNEKTIEVSGLVKGTYCGRVK